MSRVVDRTPSVGRGETTLYLGEARPWSGRALVLEGVFADLGATGREPRSTQPPRGDVEVLLSELLRAAERSLARVFLAGGMALSPGGLSRTYGGRSMAGGETDDHYWALKNDRRLYLIDKKYGAGLSPVENAELEALQADIARRAHALHPLPTEALQRLKEFAAEVTDDRATPRNGAGKS